MRCPTLIKAVNAGLFISCRLYNADTFEYLKSRVSAACSGQVLVMDNTSIPFPCDVFFIPQPGPSINYTVSFLWHSSTVLYDPTTDTFSIPDSLCKNIAEPGACTDCEYRCICPHFDTDEDLPDVDSDELKTDIRCSSIEESLKGKLANALKSSGDPIMNSESSACPEKNYPATEFVTCYDINNCPAKLTEGKKYVVVGKNENSFTIQDDNGVLAVLNRVRFQLPRITQIFKEAKYVAVDVDFWVKCVGVPTPDSSLVVGTVYHVSKVVNNHYGIDLVFFDRPSTVPFEKHFFVPCEPPEAAELLSKNVTAPKSPEEILLEATADLWNSYTKLPEFHPMEFTEVAGAIHHIQGWLAIRLNSRSDNSSFSQKVPK